MPLNAPILREVRQTISTTSGGHVYLCSMRYALAFLAIGFPAIAFGQGRPSTNDDITRALGGNSWYPPSVRPKSPADPANKGGPSPQAQPSSNINRSDQRSDFQQARSAVREYAASHGETPEQFGRRINTPPDKIEGFAYAAIKTGGDPYSAIKSLEGFSKALENPLKRKLVQCLGVKLTDDPRLEGPPPSSTECAAVKRQLNLPE